MNGYFDVQKVLDEALGSEEEDGAGGGIAGDVWLLAKQRDGARAEVAKLHSWPGLMSLLDERYPPEVFDGSSGDEGPRIVALVREVEWQPGDPVYPDERDAPGGGACSDSACGVTWPPPGPDVCPRCGSAAVPSPEGGEPA